MIEPKDRLKMAREKAGFDKPSEVAQRYKHININTYISNENGNRPISKKMAQVYADIFKVSAGWILYNETQEKTVRAPLISWISAGKIGKTADVNDWDSVPFIQAPDLDPSGDWIALRVDGRSMDKISPHDSIIFVNRNEKSLVPNACYVFSDIEGRATYKRYRPPNKLEAVTTKKEEYNSIIFNEANPPNIIGRVRKTMLSL